MSANKHKDVRCALCWSKEIAELARLHNNANALALPARFINKKQAVQIVEVFLQTPFEGGRHKKRIDKINA
jgi:ribose 5-phosphate isomerase B